jgi:hypothetical protein
VIRLPGMRVLQGNSVALRRRDYGVAPVNCGGKMAVPQARDVDPLDRNCLRRRCKAKVFVEKIPVWPHANVATVQKKIPPLNPARRNSCDS